MSPARRSVTIAAVGGLTAVAAGIGASQALADTSTPTPSGTTTAAPAVPDGATGRGGRGHGGGPGADAAALAKALGLGEAKVRAALDSVREQLGPGTPPTKGQAPSAADRAARQKEMATALAKALGVTEARVQAALDSVRAAHAAERRTDLAARLDTAVKAGTLSAADKASVLKAFDAGVLGGPGR